MAQTLASDLCWRGRLLSVCTPYDLLVNSIRLEIHWSSILPQWYLSQLYAVSLKYLLTESPFLPSDNNNKKIVIWNISMYFSYDHNAVFGIENGYFGESSRPVTVHNGSILVSVLTDG